MYWAVSIGILDLKREPLISSRFEDHEVNNASRSGDLVQDPHSGRLQRSGGPGLNAICLISISTLAEYGILFFSHPLRQRVVST